jgi:acetoin utilization deacetylase AcuC-like enzyme
MSIYYTDVFVLPLPADHKFPMSKYSLLRERLAASGAIDAAELRIPPAATDEQLLRTHAKDYLDAVKTGGLTYHQLRRIGFPWTPQMVERSRRSTGATIAAAESALDRGWGINLAGGTHHAFRDRGEGYCVFNDSVVAARHWQAEGRLRRVLIVDADVHQGNGTAALVREDETIFSFSIHGEKNFPYYKEESDLDVALPDGIGDDDYLSALEVGLQQAVARSHPDLVIYLAGADPFEKDRFGRLKLTKEGLLQRDRLVFEACRSKGLPITVAMAGGYAPDVQDTVDIHFATVSLAIQTFINSGRNLSRGLPERNPA